MVFFEKTWMWKFLVTFREGDNSAPGSGADITALAKLQCCHAIVLLAKRGDTAHQSLGFVLRVACCTTNSIRKIQGAMEIIELFRV